MSAATTGSSPPSPYRRFSTTSVKYSTPTARTSGSANGSLISPLLLATALAAAPNVAVIPTPVAGSHVSPSLRVIGAAGPAPGSLANRAAVPR